MDTHPVLSFLYLIQSFLSALSPKRENMLSFTLRLMSEKAEMAVSEFYKLQNTIESQTLTINDLRREIESVRAEAKSLNNKLTDAIYNVNIGIKMAALINDACLAVANQRGGFDVNHDEAFVKAIYVFLKRGEWIAAIKEFRWKTGYGLKEAKDVIEWLRDRFDEVER